MEEKENKKQKLPYFSICFCTILAIVNVYLFWYHPLGICIFWGILTLLAMWNVKDAADSDLDTPAVLIIWKAIQFGLFTIMTIAFANKDNTLAIAGMVTLFLHAIGNMIFDCSKNSKDAKGTILINIPFLIGYIVMIVALIYNIPF